MVMLARLALILSLIAGSVLMAPARGQMAGVLQVDLCSETGPRTVMLDARGNPVAVHHPCPDCIACVATGPLPETGGLCLATVALPLTYPLPRAVAASGIIAIHPTARDPPVLA